MSESVNRTFRSIKRDSNKVTTATVDARNVRASDTLTPGRIVAEPSSAVPFTWAYDIANPDLRSTGIEPGSTNMCGNLDLSQTSGADYPVVTTWYSYAVIFTEPYPADVQLRVVVEAANVEAGGFRTWVNDSPGAITVQPTMSAEVAALAAQPNAGFRINIQNVSASAQGNPNFNYIVFSHPV